MNKTATQLMMERYEFERMLGNPPSDIKTEEDYCRWALVQIEQYAKEIAEPYINKLVEIEKLKPPKPIFVPLGEWPAHLITPLDGESN
jgi:hypothetical protein